MRSLLSALFVSALMFVTANSTTAQLDPPQISWREEALVFIRDENVARAWLILSTSLHFLLLVVLLLYRITGRSLCCIFGFEYLFLKLSSHAKEDMKMIVRDLNSIWQR